MKQSVRLVILSIFLILLPARLALAQPELTDDEIRRILQDRVDRAKKNVAIVVGIADETGAHVIGYGRPSTKRDQTVDGDSVFEIGSVTKVFTAILLADMVERGEVGLNDPISKYLPKSVKTPTRNGKEITLLDLATHTSGLPRDPICVNLLCTDLWLVPGHYTVKQMYRFLSNYRLTRDIGAQYLYSNYGFRLLGHILALRAGMDYETLVRTRICDPLKMDSTRVTLTPEMQRRVVKGRNSILTFSTSSKQYMVPAPRRAPGAFPGAGALRSTANDLLRFAAANSGLTRTPLLTAMQRSHQPQRDLENPDSQIGLGWEIMKGFDTEIVWHNGAINGSRSFVGFDKTKRRAVVVLWNSFDDMEDIGRHLLESRYSLARRAITLDPKIFDSYVGEYQYGPDAILTISRSGHRFFSQDTGYKKVEIFAESETTFFPKGVDAEHIFVRDETGRVTHVVHREGGREYSGRKTK